MIDKDDYDKAIDIFYDIIQNFECMKTHVQDSPESVAWIDKMIEQAEQIIEAFFKKLVVIKKLKWVDRLPLSEGRYLIQTNNRGIERATISESQNELWINRFGIRPYNFKVLFPEVKWAYVKPIDKEKK